MNAYSNPKQFDNTCDFIIKLGKAAHSYGSPSIRLEAYLIRVTEALGLQGEFHSTPTNMTFAFRKSDEDWQKLHISSVSGGLDLTKLPKLDEIVDEIVAGTITLEDAGLRLKGIEEIRDPYGKAITALAYVALGASIAGVFKGCPADILFSGVLSLVVHTMVWRAGRKGGWVADWLPLSSAFVTGLLAAGVTLVVPGLNYVLVTLSAIIVLVPGYSVSIGVAEVVNNHVVSGISNLTNGLVYLFKQFIGAWLGFSLVIAFGPLLSATSTPIDPFWQWICLPVLFTALIAVFQTAPRYFLWAFLSCALSYAAVVLGGDLMGSNLGNLFGAVAAGVFANLWERKTNRPGSIVLLPALTVLVSGSIGFRGLVATAQGHSEGTGQFLDMFLVAITLTAGLIIANTLIKPKKTL